MSMIFLDEDPDYERAIARYKSVPVIITMALMLTTTPIFTGSVLAVKKSSGGAKTSSKTTTTQPHHIKGVNVFRVHTVPSKVAVGSTFNLRGIVFNNSTSSGHPTEKRC